MPRKNAANPATSNDVVDEQMATIPNESAQADVPVQELSPSHVEAVGRKTYTSPPDPFTIAHDVLAGVKLKENRQSRQMQLHFSEKPPQEVLEMVKNSDYRWNSKETAWTHRIEQDSAMTTRINAEQLFQEVASMLRKQRGIESSAGITA